jgi:hypothetical protein
MGWMYEIPNWMSCLVVMAVTAAVGVGGLFLTRRGIGRLQDRQSHNDVVGIFLSVTGIIYGIVLGLIAVATWENYSNTDAKVSAEAASVAALYRDVSALPDPARSEFQQDLRTYTQVVIQKSWPLQREGKIPDAGTEELSVFQAALDRFGPATDGQKILYAESLTAFNQLVELRRARMEAAVSGLPFPVWVVVFAGAIITLAVTWFISSLRFGVHIWMTLLLSIFLGLVIQLMVRLDKPYRGQYGISPAAFEVVYQQLMTAPQPASPPAQ